MDEFTLYVAPRFVGASDAPRVYVGDGLELGRLSLASANKLGEGVLARFVRPNANAR